jgi:hypothetical protein
MVMKKAAGGDSPLRQGAGRASRPSQSHVDDGGGLQYVFWKRVWALGFSRWGEYVGGSAMSGGGPGVHTTWWCGQGVARATLWSGYPLAPLRLCFGLRLVLGKNRNFSFCFVQFWEYLLCNFYWNTKTAENRELTLWHLINRLVPENA